ncbi:aldose epimerase family protein [Loigolactobacillus jiayinensis]|uniref:Aldose epimerase family protein n=1 Tax=Loigolactobacillus jiayinensis TaxID=2486016 RepID=A0ABW1RHU1_9LACO|nr:aldose epimerase family protein [Loigolactobacillus jiayinensis]
MTVAVEDFGSQQGTIIKRFVATNQRGTRMAVLSLGATWQEFSVLENQQRQQLIFHYDNLAAYVATNSQLGKVIGRVAGRIKDGQVTLNGQPYQLETTEKGNAIHGGTHGFSTLNFVGQTFETDSSCGVILTREIPSALDQYPGDLTLSVTYTLSDADEVTIEFTAKSTADTLFNPTNHVYWNVTDGQKSSIEQQWLQINGTQRAELRADKTPTGQLLPVAGSAYDFTKAKALGKALQQLATENGGTEFDDAYQVQPSATTPIAMVGDVGGKRHVEIFSERNGLVIYTANLTDSAAPTYNALATEAQVLPDSAHHAQFGSIVLPAGVTASTNIRYRYVAGK